MTNPTLERAARAGWPAIWHGETASPKILRMRAETIERARAVLMAVRSTDDETWDAAEKKLPHGGMWDEVGMDDVWECMIDAILNDGEGE